MTNIRVTCQYCGAPALVRPTQIVLLADSDETSGAYLFLCPICQRLTVRSPQPGEVQLLIDAGVPVGGAEGQSSSVQPSTRADAAPPFTPDDLLDFHLLLADDDCLSRLAGPVRPPLSG